MIVIALFLLGILSSQLQASIASSIDAEDVANYISQYSRQRIGGIRMMRTGGGQQCYDKYIPQISGIAERGRNESQSCNTRAQSRQQDELLKVEQQREQISRQVEAVLSWLKTCSANEDVVDYLRCLKNDGATNLNYVSQIAQVATNVSEKIESSINAIELSENNCIAAVIAKAKLDTDELFAILQRCLINGLEDPQPEPEPQPELEPETETSSEPESQTEASSVQPEPVPEQQQYDEYLPEEEV